MKRFLSLLFLLSVLLFAGCSEKREKYALSVDDPNDLLIGELNESYLAGEEVTVKTAIVDDANLHLYLDGRFVSVQRPVEAGGVFTHWEFKFTMPKKDAEISLKIYREEPVVAPAKEKYIYFDNGIVEIVYEIKFDYELTEKTYNLHKAFFENSGLKDLDYWHVFYFKNSAYLFLVFKPDKDSAEVRAFMDELKEKHEEILSIKRVEEYLFRTVYMHNPLYYGFNENQKIFFETVSTAYLPKGIYKSAEEVRAALNEVLEKDAYLSAKKAGITSLVNSLYGEEFFADNILVITDTIVTGSGSNRQEAKEVYLRDNKLYVFVKMYFVSIGTCDMQYTKFGLKIAKSFLGDYENLEQILLYDYPNLPGLW